MMARTLDINVRIQEDAEEFYLRLLEAVDSSVAQDHSEPVTPPSSPFLVRMEQSIHNLQRNETRQKEQQFLDLSLDLPPADEEVSFFLQGVESMITYNSTTVLVYSAGGSCGATV